MKRVRAHILLAALVVFCMVFSACGGENFGYRVLDTVGSEDLALAFRAGDPISKLVPAAMRELKASGTVAELAAKWLGGDATLITPETGAVSAVCAELGLEKPPQRDFIMGIDEGAVPYSYATGGGYSGFDIELARAVCEKLGWKLKIQPISSLRAETELASGNIDCAWGGLSFPQPSGKVSVSEPYLTGGHVLIVKSDSAIRRAKKLDGGSIYMRDDVEIILDLERSKVFDDISFSKKFLSSVAACFAALDKGDCDAIIVDEFALKYQLSSS